MVSGKLLRQAREGMGLSLAEIAAQTRIDVHILERLERGDFQDVPPGIYARAYLKSFARAVGLDPNVTLGLFEPLLPVADEFLAFNVNTRTAERAQQATAAQPAIPGLAGWRPSAASMIDGALLVVLNLAFLSLSASACGVSLLTMMSDAWAVMIVLFILLAFCYFGILGGIAGRTAGAHLLDVHLLDPAPGPIDLFVAGRRTAQCLLGEASILVNLLTETALTDLAPLKRHPSESRP